MRFLPGRKVWLALTLLAVAGCAAPMRKGKSPLVQAQMSPDSVVLDVYFVRVSADDVEVNEELWQDVDEQHFPADLRKRLAQNGLRVGLMGGQVSPTLSKLLELRDKPPPAGNAGETSTSMADLVSQPRVQRQHMTLRPGVRGQIVASEVYPQLPVLVCQPDGLCGQTYFQAQGMLAITQHPQGDGRVRLHLVPELYYDQPRQRWVGDQGVFRLDPSRPKRVFDSLAVTATLAPGTMLLITSLPNRPGSLGYHFFANGHDQQKLLLVRLSQTQHDDLFTPAEILPLEESPPHTPGVFTGG